MGIYNLPLCINGARAWRTYLGGMLIDREQGIKNAQDSHYPEQWMFSTVVAINPNTGVENEGLCMLADYENTSLKDVINKYPTQMLGVDHAEKWGVNLGVLIKQIDSAERLTIQVHPNKIKAKKLFNSEFGKTECWHILNTRNKDACIYLGFKEGVTRQAWEDVFKSQNLPEMLNMLHCFEVSEGDTFLVEGGVPHAIGSGCMLVEIQEPTDYTIRTERTTPSGLVIDDSLCHQGLGFDKMFDCFEYDAISKQKTADKYLIKSKRINDGVDLVNYDNTACFKMCKISFSKSKMFQAENKYYMLYILSGSGTIKVGAKEIEIEANSQLFISASCLNFEIIPKNSEQIEIFKFEGPK